MYEDVKEAAGLMNKWISKAREANNKAAELFRWIIDELRRDYVRHYDDEDGIDGILWQEEYRITEYDIQYAERVLNCRNIPCTLR